FFVLVFLLDFLKGALPVTFAYMPHLFVGRPQHPFLYLPEAAGFAAILGHMFPIFLNFKGGKGVATSVGVVLCLMPHAALSGLGAFLLVLLLTRMVSAGSLAFAVTFAVVYFVRTPQPWSALLLPRSLFAVVVVLLVFLRHRTNILRMAYRMESKINFPWHKKPLQSEPAPLDPGPPEGIRS
ncbi:MAG TPA: glycerol-3-phosphate acyltransferase, partial [Planctomycetia bacterium]|nr:glycerol-3-phosphate acyltransferase [Planctomycetia bacterium]